MQRPAVYRTISIDDQSFQLIPRLLTRAPLSPARLREYRSLGDEEFTPVESNAGYSMWLVPIRFKDVILVCDSPTDDLAGHIQMKGNFLIKKSTDDDNNNNESDCVPGAPKLVVLRFKHKFVPTTTVSIQGDRFRQHTFLRKSTDTVATQRIDLMQVFQASALLLFWMCVLWFFVIKN